MATSDERRGYADWIVCAALIVLTALVFAQAAAFPFINYDDDHYVYANPAAANGLNAESIVWAFTTFHYASWHPLTWLSHLADVSLFAMNPARHHLTNILLHTANVLLLYLVLMRLTAARWPSVCVAALFAVHPLHVEPVVWIASRKDVLCAFFWLAALWAYTAYARKPAPGRYAAVIALTAAALMSKTMAMTLPFVLLLFDIWPLGRLRLDDRATWRKPLLEKLPLFALSAITAAITYAAQSQGGALMPTDRIPLAARLENAVASYGYYLAKTVWPTNLAPFYPFPAAGNGFTVVALSIAALAALTIAAWFLRRRVPAATIGWLWFVGTPIPVIGLIQTGAHARADRFVYLPHIGLFVAVVWTVYTLTPPMRRRYLALPAAAVCFALMWTAGLQVQRWRDPVVLFEHSLAAAGHSGRILNNLGNAYLARNDTAAAIARFDEALRRDPDTLNVRTNLGAALLMEQRPAEAVAVLEPVTQSEPNNAVALTNYAYGLALLGRMPEAQTHADRAAAITPPYPQAKALADALRAGAVQPLPLETTP